MGMELLPMFVVLMAKLTELLPVLEVLPKEEKYLTLASTIKLCSPSVRLERMYEVGWLYRACNSW